MDHCIDKMNGIYNEFSRRNQSEKLCREELLDYQQEIYRQKAIFNHIGRGYRNDAGRYTGLALGTVVGYLIGATTFKVNQRGLLVYATMLGYSVFGGALGYYLFSRIYGSRSEYAVFRRKKVTADEVYDRFQELAKTIKF
jgi:hypothetical protein